LVEQVGDAPGVASGFLDADDRFDIRQCLEHVRRDIDSIDRRVVVTHDRQIGCRRYCAEMIHRLARVRVVNHAGHDHEPIDSGGGRRPCSLAGVGSGELCDSVEQGDAVAADFLGRLEHLHLLIQR
jgi:hypothetical protein